MHFNSGRFMCICGKVVGFVGILWILAKFLVKNENCLKFNFVSSIFVMERLTVMMDTTRIRGFVQQVRHQITY